MSALALKIIEIIFETAIATGATQFTEEAIARGKMLLGKVTARFPQFKKALQQAEEQQSRAILEAEIVQPLAEEMESDRKFAEELEAIVREIAELKTRNQTQTQDRPEIGTNQQNQGNQGNQPVLNVGQNQGGINLNLSQ